MKINALIAIEVDKTKKKVNNTAKLVLKLKIVRYIYFESDFRYRS